MFVPAPRRSIVVLTLLLAIGGMTPALPQAVAANAQEAGLPSLEEVPLRPFLDFAVPEDHWQVRLSPDGEQAAYLTRVEGVVELWSWSRATNEHRRLLAPDAVPGEVVEFLWLADGDRLILRARETSLSTMPVRTQQGMVDRPVQSVADRLFLLAPLGELRDLTPSAGSRSKLLAVDAGVPETVLIGVEGVVPGLYDAVHLNVRTGEAPVVYEPEVGSARFLIGPDLQVLAMERLAKRNYFNERSLLPNQDLLPEAQFPLARWVDPDLIRSGGLWISPDLQTLISKDSRGRDETIIARTDLVRGHREVLSQREGVDIRDALIDEANGQVLAVSYELGALEWDVLDPSLQPDFDWLAASLVHGFDITQRVADGAVWLLQAPDQHGILDYWRYERGSQELSRVCSDREALRGRILGRMETLSFPAADGATLWGYLTLPPDVATSGDLREAPMVLLPNPTLWERGHFRYDSFAQWLANRGYAVFQPITRGAPGFGKEFERQGYGAFDGLLLSDHLDCARWLSEAGYTSPDRLAVVGHGIAGSLATLALGQGEGLFAAGVNYFGYLDLIRLLEILPEGSTMELYYKERIGDRLKEKPKLAQASPIASLVTADRPFFLARRAQDASIRGEDLLALQSYQTYRDFSALDVVARPRRDGSLEPAVADRVDRLLSSFLAFCLGGRNDPIWESEIGGDVEIRMDTSYLLWEEPLEAPTGEAAELPVELPDSPG
ncbi:MAG: alpha/beta hydrolase family protein [Phycisphaerales bacterium JB038]